MFGTGLLVFPESSDYSGAIINREESCLVGKIVNHPVRDDTHDHGNQTFEDENPSLVRNVLASGWSCKFLSLPTQPGLPPTPFI